MATAAAGCCSRWLAAAQGCQSCAHPQLVAPQGQGCRRRWPSRPPSFQSCTAGRWQPPRSPPLLLLRLLPPRLRQRLQTAELARWQTAAVALASASGCKPPASAANEPPPWPGFPGRSAPGTQPPACWPSRLQLRRGLRRACPACALPPRWLPLPPAAPTAAAATPGRCPRPRPAAEATALAPCRMWALGAGRTAIQRSGWRSWPRSAGRRCCVPLPQPAARPLGPARTPLQQAGQKGLRLKELDGRLWRLGTQAAKCGVQGGSQAPAAARAGPGPALPAAARTRAGIVVVVVQPEEHVGAQLLQRGLHAAVERRQVGGWPAPGRRAAAGGAAGQGWWAGRHGRASRPQGKHCSSNTPTPPAHTGTHPATHLDRLE